MRKSPKNWCETQKYAYCVIIGFSIWGCIFNNDIKNCFILVHIKIANNCIVKIKMNNLLKLYTHKTIFLQFKFLCLLKGHSQMTSQSGNYNPMIQSWELGSLFVTMRGKEMVLHLQLSTNCGLGNLLLAKSIFSNTPTANFTVVWWPPTCVEISLHNITFQIFPTSVYNYHLSSLKFYESTSLKLYQSSIVFQICDPSFLYGSSIVY